MDLTPACVVYISSTIVFGLPGIVQFSITDFFQINYLMYFVNGNSDSLVEKDINTSNMSNFTAYRYYSTNSSATSVSLLTIPSGLDDYDDVSNQVSYTISAYERK